MRWLRRQRAREPLDSTGHQWPTQLFRDEDARAASTSSNVLTRAAAGVRLAAAPTVDDTLLVLLHDPENTFVIEATAEALVARRDRAGLRLLLCAYAGADELAGYRIRDAVIWPPDGTDYPEVRPTMNDREALLQDLERDSDLAVATIATRFLAGLAGEDI